MNILNKLTIKHLTQNKKRTVVSIIGIILSTALMVGIGLLFATVRDNSIKMIESSSGNHHIRIDVPKDKIDIVAKNKNIKNYKYKSSIGFALYSDIENFYKPYIHVLDADSNYLNELEVIEGRLPQNNHELLVSEHLFNNNDVKLKIGDKIKLKVGKRVDLEGNILINESFSYIIENDNTLVYEKLIDEKDIEYTIVGICKRDILENYSNPGYSAFTTLDNTDNLNVYIQYNDVDKTYELTGKLGANLGYERLDNNGKTPFFKEVEYNSNLLSMYGVSMYDNVTNSLVQVICIILALVSVACAIVIYNSFAISVMERKKQFGLFSSIGTTRKQLKYTVFYEAFIVGIIGIPLGIVSAYIGIGIVIQIINHLLPDVFGTPLALVTYPLFITIPVIFMIITILVSAYLPSRRASRVSPITAIRQNDDIKIKSKKVKAPKIITKLFGVEGELAYKNMKRNKKKYRITIVSLFISIVLFISFSSIVKYGLESAYDFTNMPDFDYSVTINGDIENKDKINEIAQSIISLDEVTKGVIIEKSYIPIYNDDLKYSDNFKNSIFYSDDFKISSAYIVKLNKEAYEQYKKEVGLSSNRPIVINTYSQVVYSNAARKTVTVDIFDSINNLKLAYYDNESGELSSKVHELTNFYLTNKLPLGMYGNINWITIIVDDETYDKIVSSSNDLSYSKEINLIASNYDNIDELVDKENIKPISIYSFNVKEEMQLLSNMILVVKILLYGFISLVTLIGVTSVLNTINTSIALRRTEFAVLRSIGLSPHQFNKILFFESLFFGLKSLLYGIPVGLLITFLLHMSFSGIVEFSSLLIPWGSIFITIIGVFIIVAICMWYSSIKIKHENILDAIRDETI